MKCWLTHRRPDVRVAGLGDPAPRGRLARRRLRRHEADVGHERPGAGEAGEVADLDGDPEGGDGRDAAQGAEPEVTPARSSAPDLSAMAESRRSRRSSHSLTCATYSSSTSRCTGRRSMERSHSRCALVHVDLPLGHTWPFPGRNFDSWWRALITPRARPRGRGQVARRLHGRRGRGARRTSTASSLRGRGRPSCRS